MRELVREQSNYGTNVVATWTEQVKSMLRIHQHQRWQYEHFIDTCTSTIIKHKSTGGSKTQKLMTGRIPTYASNSWTTRYNSATGGHRKGSLWYLIKKRFTSCQLNISAHRGRQGERSGKLALVAAHLEKLSPRPSSDSRPWRVGKLVSVTYSHGAVLHVQKREEMGNLLPDSNVQAFVDSNDGSGEVSECIIRSLTIFFGSILTSTPRSRSLSSFSLSFPDLHPCTSNVPHFDSVKDCKLVSCCMHAGISTIL